MKGLRRVVSLAAILLNVLWAARMVWAIWGLIDWSRVLTSNPFGYGRGWLVWVSLFAPTLAVVALVWSFRWNDEPASIR